MPKKTKHNVPKKPKPNFIPFNEVQQGFLLEIRNRQMREFNEAVDKICKQLGIVEKIKKAPEMYKLRLNDLCGIDIVPVKPPGKG